MEIFSSPKKLERGKESILVISLRICFKLFGIFSGLPFFLTRYLNRNGVRNIVNELSPSNKGKRKKIERKEGKNENWYEESNWIPWNDEYEKESKDERMRRKREEEKLRNERMKDQVKESSGKIPPKRS